MNINFFKLKKDNAILVSRLKDSRILYAPYINERGISMPMVHARGSDYLRFDDKQNGVKSFFEKHLRYYSVSDFEFFRLPAGNIINSVKKLEIAIAAPMVSENKAFIDKHRIEPIDYLKETHQQKAGILEKFMNLLNDKTDFMFPNDYKNTVEAGKVIPDERHKRQVVVNSGVISNEAIKKPLKQGQTQPTEKQQEKQAEKQEKAQKSPLSSKSPKSPKPKM